MGTEAFTSAVQLTSGENVSAGSLEYFTHTQFWAEKHLIKTMFCSEWWEQGYLGSNHY